MEDPKSSSWRCTASVCVLIVHRWEISMEHYYLSVILIYTRIFLRVFIVYHLIIRFLILFLYFIPGLSFD